MKRRKLPFRLILLICLGFSFLGQVTPAFGANDPETNIPEFFVSQNVTLSAEDGSLEDNFGWSLAVSGDTLVVGARNEDPEINGEPIHNAGSVYVFVKKDSIWTQQAKLVASDTASYDGFGTSVDIQGDVIVVGANGANITKDKKSYNNAGAAYVFERNGTTWEQRIKLSAGDPEQDGFFGADVAITKGKIAIGADGADVGGVPNAGAVYVYIRSGKTWYQNIKLIASDLQPDALLGSSVDIDGNTLIAGAPEPGSYLVRPGAAYIFSHNGGKNWRQAAKLVSDTTTEGDYFGQSVAIEGGTAVVGAVYQDITPKDKNNPTGLTIKDAGAVFVFSQRGSNWQQKAKLVAQDASPFDNFGESVAIDNNLIVVGAASDDPIGMNAAGSSYVFRYNEGKWQQLNKLVTFAPAAEDALGKSVAISGDTIIIGATGRDANQYRNAGAALTFSLKKGMLPSTGFPQGENSQLAIEPPPQSPEAGLTLEIPGYPHQIPIVDVPFGADGWDVSWLHNQAGYLQGSAYPTWKGNTAIAAHVYNTDGRPGPFVNLYQLKWGDQIIIHAWGMRHVYVVREIREVAPDDLSVLAHSDQDLLTLITCKGFNESASSYELRLAVQAVLISVE